MSDVPLWPCAKFILGGEHSVVSRGRALSFPISDLKLEISWEETNLPEVYLNDAKLELALKLKVFEVINVFFNKERIKTHSLKITTGIPIGSGLGSSAALCAALARSANPTLHGEDWARAALEGEKIFHGTPSGVDPWTVCLQKPIVFRAHDKTYREIKMERFLYSEAFFVLIDSGETHNTAQVITQTNELKQKTPLIYENLMTSLASNTETMLQAIESGELNLLGHMMSDSHFRLQQLGVSTEKLDEAVATLKAAGALGAKLTGAGCGGFAVGLFINKPTFEIEKSFTVKV